MKSFAQNLITLIGREQGKLCKSSQKRHKTQQISSLFSALQQAQSLMNKMSKLLILDLTNAALLQFLQEQRARLGDAIPVKIVHVSVSMNHERGESTWAKNDRELVVTFHCLERLVFDATETTEWMS